MTLVEFLRAMLDRDEAIARAARPLSPWSTPGNDGPAEGMLYAGGWAIAQFGMYPDGIANSSSRPGYLPAFPTTQVLHIENAVHAARHDPARVLRKVEAGRKLLAEYERISASLAAYPGPANAAAYMAMQTAIKIEAGVYADHPDFKEAWRV
jgi:hypothetical protein